MHFLTLYLLLIISLILSKLNFYFYYLIFLILISPLIFYNLENFGLKNFKAALIGILSSLIYFPFLTFNFQYLNFFPQVFAEEIFFRGYIQNEIFLRINNIHLSVFITSFMFCMPHVILSFSLISFLTFFPSLIFGYLYYFTKSVWASTLFHFFSNVFFLSNYVWIFKVL
jgi:hypothetical protein